MKQRIYKDRHGNEFIIPFQWKEFLGQDVLNYKKTLASRMREVNTTQRYFVDYCKQLDDFNLWYDPKKQKAACMTINLKGNKEAVEKRQRTCLIKYGTENPFSSDSIKNKIKETNIQKYGFEHPMLSDRIKRKSRENNPTTLSSEEARKRAILQGVEPLEEIVTTNPSKHYRGKCLVDDSHPEFLFHFTTFGAVSVCPQCNRQSTKFERSLSFKLFEEGFENIPHYRAQFMGNKEIDIFIPSLNIGIEVNGAFSHNSDFFPKYQQSGPKSPTYHIEKSEMCLSHNISLFHIWEELDKKSQLNHIFEILKSLRSGLKLHLNKGIYKRDLYPNPDLFEFGGEYEFDKNPNKYLYFTNAESTKYGWTAKQRALISADLVPPCEDFNANSYLELGIYRVFDSGNLIIK